MLKTKFKLGSIVFLSLLFVLATCFTVFAYAYSETNGYKWDDTAKGWYVDGSVTIDNKEYDDTKIDWQYDGDGGKVIAKWVPYPGAKGYLVQLYKLNDNDQMSKVLTNPLRVSNGLSRDVTKYIAKKGAGRYRYGIFPAKVDEDGEYVEIERYPLLSTGILSVGENDIKLMQSNNPSITVNTTNENSDGWHEFPGNNWTYGKGNNTLAKNEWLDINGKRYHFNSKGMMDKGWIQLNGAYYYLDPTNGNLWVNTTTPDGFIVNSEGVRVDNAGNKVTGAPVNAKVTVSLEETGENGTIKKAAVTGVTNANLVEWSFGIPYEQWQVGIPVKLYVKVVSNNGFPFDKKSTFSCSNATFKSFYGSDPVVVEFDYYPKMKLSTPTNLTIDSSNIVKWAAVPNAHSYTVRIYSDAGENKSYTVSGTRTDVSEYLNSSDTISVGIIATYNKSGKSSNVGRYYTSSDEAKLTDIQSMVDNNLVSEGEFYSSNGNLYFNDESGNRVKGWKKILNNWYYFDKVGKAVGPGWWQDADGNWYYFNNEHKMQVGTITDNGKQYFMNDGSNANFPYGAWVH